MSANKYLKDKQGNRINPITSTEAVKDSQGTSVQTLIDNLSLSTKAATDANRTAIQTEVARATAAEDELRALYQALTQTDVVPVAAADWPLATLEQNTIYRVAGSGSYTDYMYDGESTIAMATYNNAIDDIPTIDSDNLVKSGGVALYAGAFNVSEYKKSGSTLATFSSISEVLTSAATNIPTAYRIPGMSIKFIQLTPATYIVVKTEGVTLETAPTENILSAASSVVSGVYTASQLTDFSGVSALPATVGSANAKTYYLATDDTYTTWVITKATNDIQKYVQYRLMSTAFSTNVSDWQGVDDEPTAGSDNLVKSGGVKKELTKLQNNIVSIHTSVTEGKYITSQGSITTNNPVFGYCDYIPVYKGASLIFYNTVGSGYPDAQGAWYDNNKTRITNINLSILGIGVQTLQVPNNARYVRLSLVLEYRDDFFASVDYAPVLATIDPNMDVPAAIAALTRVSDDATGFEGIYTGSDYYTSEKALNSSGVLISKGFTYTNERFLRCKGGEKVYSKLRTFEGNLEIAFYSDANESSFISGIEGNNTLNERVVTIPDNANYLRYSTINISQSYLYYNTDARLYEINKTLEVLPTFQNEIDEIKANQGGADDIPFTFTGQKDIFVNTGGESGFGTTNWVTDYIDIHNYNIIEFLNRYTAVVAAPPLGFAFYDAQKTYIGGSPCSYGRITDVGGRIKATEVIVPNGAYYFRTSIQDSYKDKFYIKGYKEDAKGFNLVYGGKKTLAVANSLNVGDTIALSSASATLTFYLPTFGAKGVYIPTYVGDTSFVEYAVIDKDNKILKKGANTAHDERITYVDLTDVAEAVAIWFTTYYNDVFVSHVIYNNGEFLMDNGYKKDIYSISNSVKIGETADKDEIYNVNVVNTTDGKVVTIDFQGECMSNLSLYAKIKSMTDIDKIDSVVISWYIGTTLIVNSSVKGNTLFQTNDWVRIQRCKTSGHQTFTANQVQILFNFASGQSSDSNFDLQICKSMIVDSFYKPIFGINFDHTWVATDTCGVYDELINNNIPFTITGGWSVNQTIGDKILAQYKKGLCDIGKYGGNTDPDQLMISTSVDYPTLLSRIAECIQYRNTQGIECVSFGPGSHLMSSMLFRALDTNGFKCIRCGNTGNDNINLIPRNNKGIIEGGQATCFNMGTLGVLFAHGISTNPSGETNPSMYLVYSTYEEFYTRALGFYQQGAALILNMKQIAELRKKYDLFGLKL